MRGAQRDSAHYKCAISFAGISDLSAMKRYDTKFLLGPYGKAYWTKQVSDFSIVSPRFHAADFSVPILIAHGVEDKRVPFTSLQLIGPRLSEAQLLNAGRIIEAKR